jgi:hypothetical protein
MENMSARTQIVILPVILEWVFDRRSTAHTFLLCHFVVPKARSALLKHKRNGEIFAAGNGRNVVKSVLDSSLSFSLRMTVCGEERIPTYFFANAQE